MQPWQNIPNSPNFLSGGSTLSNGPKFFGPAGFSSKVYLPPRHNRGDKGFETYSIFYQGKAATWDAGESVEK